MEGKRISYCAALSILGIIFLLSSCVTTNSQFIRPEAPPSGQSIVYFYRNDLTINAISPGINHNGNKVLYLMPDKRFWKFYIQPGVHLFELDQFGSYKKYPLTLTNRKPGKVYYVEMVIDAGYLSLQRRSNFVGLAKIAQCHETRSATDGYSSSASVNNQAFSDSRASNVKAGSASLYVMAKPKNARIRIMNIKPKFHQGIVLKHGRYEIKVSSPGYIAESKWINLKRGEHLDHYVALSSKISHKSAVKAPVTFASGISITDPKIAGIARMLESDNPINKRDAAKRIIKNYPGQVQLLSLAGQQLQEGYGIHPNNRYHVDAMALLCDVIGVSGKSKYKPFLLKIARHTKNQKIKSHALKNAKLL
ncbi:MAG: hypothetical protein GY710_16755 [Desulfobacteraceae bacterium]|nr:hypothetical protein [Desulfobacteraceae bacterium]